MSHIFAAYFDLIVLKSKMGNNYFGKLLRLLWELCIIYCQTFKLSFVLWLWLQLRFSIHLPYNATSIPFWLILWLCLLATSRNTIPDSKGLCSPTPPIHPQTISIHSDCSYSLRFMICRTHFTGSSKIMKIFGWPGGALWLCGAFLWVYVNQAKLVAIQFAH